MPRCQWTLMDGAVTVNGELSPEWQTLSSGGWMLKAVYGDAFDLNDPIAVLLAVVQALEHAGIEGSVYGGLALAAYGEPRETKDADLAVTGIQGTEVVERQAEFDVVEAFDRKVFGGLFVSRYTLLGGEAGALNTADLVEPRSIRYARQVLARSIGGSLRQRPVRVVSPEDFVVMKVLSSETTTKSVPGWRQRANSRAVLRPISASPREQSV